MGLSMKRVKADLIYTAGLFDGEGCISLARTSSTNASRHYAVTLLVEVSNTNEWIIQWLRFNYGGGIYYQDRTSSQFSNVWRWQLRCKQAVRFLQLIFPYLKLKRPQAELAIQFQSRQKRGQRLTDEKIALDEANRVLMGKYNKRGRSADG